MIDQLLQASTAEEKQQLMMEMRAKNIGFFHKKLPEKSFAKSIAENTSNKYFLDFTPDFFNIFEKDSGLYCHPANGLLEHVEKIAQWYHKDWIDLVNGLQTTYVEEHGRLINGFTVNTQRCCPGINLRVLQEKIDLPTSEDGKHAYLGPVVFLGIFHGLHIIKFLETASPSHIMLVEPDINSFLLSCHIIDYQALYERFGSLNIVVGKGNLDDVLHQFLNQVTVTRNVWIRFLPIYKSELFDDIINRIKLSWRMHEIHVPYEREVNNLTYGLNNVLSKHLFLTEKPGIRGNYAVVGAGPSLLEDLDWLKDNQAKIIIVCATTASLVLKKHGIQPDIQVLLDTELTDEEWESIGLDETIPTVCYYKVSPELLAKLERPVLIVERHMPNPVWFKHTFMNTHPTSGNLAFCLVCNLNPKAIFLLGMDLGTKDVGDDHATNVLTGEKKCQYIGREWIPHKETNFSESADNFYTHSYLLIAKITIENAITFLENVEVINFSDGIGIKGSTAKHTSDFPFMETETKDKVLSTLDDGFRPLEEGDWNKYQMSAQALLDELKESIKILFAEQFEWEEFVFVIDKKIRRLITGMIKKQEGGDRIYVFQKLIENALTAWYRLLVFAESQEEVERLYKVGRCEFFKLIDELSFPSSLG
jgi:hypothetical protein